MAKRSSATAGPGSTFLMIGIYAVVIYVVVKMLPSLLKTTSAGTLGSGSATTRYSTAGGQTSAVSSSLLASLLAALLGKNSSSQASKNGASTSSSDKKSPSSTSSAKTNAATTAGESPNWDIVNSWKEGLYGNGLEMGAEANGEIAQYDLGSGDDANLMQLNDAGIDASPSQPSLFDFGSWGTSADAPTDYSGLFDGQSTSTDSVSGDVGYYDYSNDMGGSGSGYGSDGGEGGGYDDSYDMGGAY